MAKKARSTFIYILLLSLVVIILIPPFFYFYYRRFVYVSVNAVEKGKHTLLVLGASVIENSKPSAALQDRLNLAHKLYLDGKVERIIVSGARDSEDYDEPFVMKNELVNLGIPEELIIEDPRGYSTFDSCINAKDTYNSDEVTILSQGFHLPRALFICKSIGISNATGVYSTGSFSTNYSRWYTVREVMAMYKAIWDVVRY